MTMDTPNTSLPPLGTRVVVFDMGVHHGRVTAHGPDVTIQRRKYSPSHWVTVALDDGRDWHGTYELLRAAYDRDAAYGSVFDAAYNAAARYIRAHDAAEDKAAWWRGLNAEIAWKLEVAADCRHGAGMRRAGADADRAEAWAALAAVRGARMARLTLEAREG